MSFKTLLTHKCDVYHLQKRSASPGYGLPGEAEFHYNDVPDLTEVPCYFTEKHQAITQDTPGDKIVHRFAVSFLVGTDVRLNDKVVWNGLELKAQIPRKVKNHHVEVDVVRDEAV